MNMYMKFGRALLLFLCAVLVSCSGGAGNSANPGRKTTANKVLSSDYQITTDTADQDQPSVAYDSVNNRYLTVFVDRSTGTTQIHGSIVAGSDSLGPLRQGDPDNVTTVTKIGSDVTTPTGEDFAITASAGNKAQPKVAFYPDPATGKSRYLVVWTDSRNVGGGLGSQIYAQFVDPHGKLLGQNFAISTLDAYYHSQSDPDLIYNSVTKKFSVAWVDTAPWDRDFIAAEVERIVQGTIDNPPVPIVDQNLIQKCEVAPAPADPNPGDNTPPAFVTTPEPLESDLASNSDFDDNGAVITESWNVQEHEAHPKLTFNPLSGETLATWSGSTTKVTVTIKYETSTVGVPPVRVITFKSIAYLNEDLDGGVTKIKFRRKQANVYTDLSFGTAATNPALAVDPNTNLLLMAWEDNDGGATSGKNIMGQLFDLTGFTSYGNLITIAAQRTAAGAVIAAVCYQTSRWSPSTT